MNRFAKLAFLIIALVVPTALAQLPPPQVPPEIKVPNGHRVVAKYKAKGVQIYQAVTGEDGRLEWKFEGPLAELCDEKGDKVAIHYGPAFSPAWEATDGSKVYKPKEQKATPETKKRPTEIPWLLVPVISDDAKDAKQGKFSSIVFVQRVSTSGGMAPKDLPKRLGSKVGVPYTAVYYFWAKANLHLRDGGKGSHLCPEKAERPANKGP